jgi:hypothetical protein
MEPLRNDAVNGRRSVLSFAKTQNAFEMNTMPTAL